MENGDIPEDANERMNIFIFMCFNFPLFLYIPFTLILVFFVLWLAFTDCPGPQSDSAGKSDACEGCPNQQICATAPKGPDPGCYSSPLSYAFMFISNNHQILLVT